MQIEPTSPPHRTSSRAAVPGFEGASFPRRVLFRPRTIADRALLARSPPALQLGPRRGRGSPSEAPSALDERFRACRPRDGLLGCSSSGGSSEHRYVDLSPSLVPDLQLMLDEPHREPTSPLLDPFSAHQCVLVPPPCALAVHISRCVLTQLSLQRYRTSCRSSRPVRPSPSTLPSLPELQLTRPLLALQQLRWASLYRSRTTCIAVAHPLCERRRSRKSLEPTREGRPRLSGASLPRAVTAVPRRGLQRPGERLLRS